MRSRFLRSFGAIMLGVAVFAGLTTFAVPGAQAQRRVIIVRRPFYRHYDPFWDPWGYNRLDRLRYQQYVFSNPEKAFQEGYDAGLKVGRGDIKNSRSYKPERSHYYYEAGFGNFGEVYRRGFARGYADGYRG